MEPRTEKLLSTSTGNASQINSKSLGFCSFGRAFILGISDINMLQNAYLCFNSDENVHRWGIEQAAGSAVGGNLMLELLKEFVGRLMPNDRKVCTSSTVNDLSPNCTFSNDYCNKLSILSSFKEVLAFLGTKTGSLGGGREEQAILVSYEAALNGLGRKDKRPPQAN